MVSATCSLLHVHGNQYVEITSFCANYYMIMWCLIVKCIALLLFFYTVLIFQNLVKVFLSIFSSLAVDVMSKYRSNCVKNEKVSRVFISIS